MHGIRELRILAKRATKGYGKLSDKFRYTYGKVFSSEIHYVCILRMLRHKQVAQKADEAPHRSKDGCNSNSPHWNIESKVKEQ